MATPADGACLEHASEVGGHETAQSSAPSLQGQDDRCDLEVDGPAQDAWAGEDL